MSILSASDVSSLFAEATSAVEKVSSRAVRLCQEWLVAPALELVASLPRLTDSWQADGDALPSYAHEPLSYVTKVHCAGVVEQCRSGTTS